MNWLRPADLLFGFEMPCSRYENLDEYLRFRTRGELFAQLGQSGRLRPTAPSEGLTLGRSRKRLRSATCRTLVRPATSYSVASAA